MNLKFNLNMNLEQKQNLIMTPQLQMAIEILQFSKQELEEYIDEELKTNLLLEKVEKQSDGLEKGIDYSINNDDQEFNYENFAAYQPNLIEYLESQLYQVLSIEEMTIGRYIIGNLDEEGFLTLSKEEICHNLDIEMKKLSTILSKVQHLDPVGIAASSLQESLLIQLDNLLLDTTLAERIVKNYLTELAEQDYQEIIKKTAEEEKKVLGAINLIKTLNPHPATNISQREKVEYLVPDLIVKEINGRYVITYNDSTIPYLKISPYYYQLLKKSEDKETYNFLNKKYRSALWLIRSIEQRKITIYRIVEAIIEKQADFFSYGIKHLSPMTMQEIADKIDMHESTVSRATNEKYIQTPQGLFNLKFFFNSGIDHLSSVSIKVMIGEYIKNEDPARPLSDSKIVQLFKDYRGLSLSRRTVAKYRSEMGIPSSLKRKNKKNDN